MEYVQLGTSGLRVSAIVLGCMSYGDPGRGSHAWSLPEDKSRPFLRRALESGITTFDTADVYSDGTSEEIVGRALKDLAQREEVVVATKVHGRMYGGPHGGGLSRAGDLLLAPLAEDLERRLTFHRRPRLTTARFGDEAGCVGAGLWARDLLELE